LQHRPRTPEWSDCTTPAARRLLGQRLHPVYPCRTHTRGSGTDSQLTSPLSGSSLPRNKCSAGRWPVAGRHGRMFVTRSNHHTTAPCRVVSPPQRRGAFGRNAGTNKQCGSAWEGRGVARTSAGGCTHGMKDYDGGEKGERDGVGGVWRMRSGRSIFGTDGKGSPVRGGWLAGRGYKGLDLGVRLVCVLSSAQALKRSSARAHTLSTAANVESASLGSGRDEA
jgi:hypothetical protein